MVPLRGIKSDVGRDTGLVCQTGGIILAEDEAVARPQSGIALINQPAVALGGSGNEFHGGCRTRQSRGLGRLGPETGRRSCPSPKGNRPDKSASRCAGWEWE